MELSLVYHAVMAWLMVSSPIIFFLPITHTRVDLTIDDVSSFLLRRLDERRPIGDHLFAIIENEFGLLIHGVSP